MISDKLQIKYAIHVLRVNYRQLLENPDLPWLMHEITKVKPEKREAAATHDAMNFILVEERRKTLREQPPLTGLLPSNVWMISYDKSLHKFGDAAKTQLGSDISYLIYGASWVEMVSPLIPLDAELPFDVADIIGVLSKHSFLFLGKEISTEQLSLVFQSVPPSGENFSLMLKMLGNEHYREALEKEEKEHSLTRGSVNVVIRQYLAEIKAEQQVSRREQEALRKNGDNEWNHTEEVNKTLEATLNNAQKLLEEKDKQLISITEKMRQLEEAERTRIETEGARTTQRRKAVKRVVLFLSYLMLIGIPSYFLMSKGLHVAVILTAIAGLASIILQFRKGVLAKLLSIGALLCAVCISAGYLLFADHLWEWIGSAILGILLFIVDRTNLHEKIGSIST